MTKNDYPMVQTFKTFSNIPLTADFRFILDTIATGIKIATDELAKGKPPGTKIHVWFTGHSLGTAIASLAYSKALLSKDIGSSALLRDAYLFATPIVVRCLLTLRRDTSSNCYGEYSQILSAVRVGQILMMILTVPF
jgi:Lipase (class 3)